MHLTDLALCTVSLNVFMPVDNGLLIYLPSKKKCEFVPQQCYIFHKLYKTISNEVSCSMVIAKEYFCIDFPCPFCIYHVCVCMCVCDTTNFVVIFITLYKSHVLPVFQHFTFLWDLWIVLNCEVEQKNSFSCIATEMAFYVSVHVAQTTYKVFTTQYFVIVF